MNAFLIFGMLGGYEVLGILAIVLVLFGAKKLPELARGLGTGIKEFKKATSDVTQDLQRAIDDDYEPAQPRRSSQQTQDSASESDESGHAAPTSSKNQGDNPSA